MAVSANPMDSRAFATFLLYEVRHQQVRQPRGPVHRSAVVAPARVGCRLRYHARDWRRDSGADPVAHRDNPLPGSPKE